MDIVSYGPQRKRMLPAQSLKTSICYVLLVLHGLHPQIEFTLGFSNLSSDFLLSDFIRQRQFPGISLENKVDTGTFIMSTADELLELMFSWIEERECCAEQLRKLAQELESLREKCNAVECVGSVASVVGAASMIGAGVATFFTAGAAAPLLAVAGGVYTGLGVTVSVATKITEHFLSSDTLKEAQQIEENSNNIARKIQKQFEQLNAQAKERSPFADPDGVDQHVMTEIVGAMARRSGLGQNIGFSTEFFSNPALGAMMMNQSSNSAMAAGFTLQVVSILTFFSLKNGGKKFDILFAEGAKQLVKKVATTGFKTALKGGAMVRFTKYRHMYCLIIT